MVEKTDGVVRRISSDGASVSTLALPANSAVNAIATDPAGTLYCAGADGLMMLPLGGSPSLLIRRSSLQLGASPSLPSVQGIAILATGQLVLLSEGQILRATLP